MPQLKSKLLERELRFDGVSEIDPGQLSRMLLLGVPPAKLRVTTLTDDVELFNTQVADKDQIKEVAPEPISLNMAWELPEAYQSLDLAEYVGAIFETKCSTYTEDEVDKALDRIALELNEVEKRGMVEFMRTVIFIMDELRANDVVWGVGRGSSCASYLLFLIGLHVVDCVKMDVSHEEFYHD